MQARPDGNWPLWLQAVAHMEALVEDGTGHAQYVRLRQAYTQLTTTQPWGNFKQARRGSLSYAV